MRSDPLAALGQPFSSPYLHPSRRTLRPHRRSHPACSLARGLPRVVARRERAALLGLELNPLHHAHEELPTLSLPRAELYFGDQHMSLAHEDLALTSAIRSSHCGHIAMDAYIPIPDDQIQNSPPGFWIYPLFAQLNIDGRTRSIEYINVQNRSRNFTPVKQHAPACAIICLDCLSSHGAKSDAYLGPTQTFGTSQLTFATTEP